MTSKSDLAAIDLARKNIEEDYTLSVFIVRDLEVVSELGLDDLVWAMYKHGCVKSEAEHLINHLEKHAVNIERELHNER